MAWHEVIPNMRSSPFGSQPRDAIKGRDSLTTYLLPQKDRRQMSTNGKAFALLAWPRARKLLQRRKCLRRRSTRKVRYRTDCRAGDIYS
jgi:hypothetical protein